MYESLEITNFRCFEHLRFTDLARVNLIAGKNSTGKTTLLEALYIHAMRGSPLAIEELSESRGTGHRAREATGDALWGTLFFGRDTSREITLANPVEEGGAPVHTVRLAESRDREALNIAYETPDGVRERDRMAAPLKGTRVSITWRATYEPVFVWAGHRPSPEDLAVDFSEFVKTKRKHEIVEVMRLVEPRINDLELLREGGVTAVHADIGLDRLVPLSVAGDGLVRLTQYALAVSNAPQCLVLIDEFESGLHYSVLRDVWRVVAEAARRHDVQVFATTHSWECIRAAHEAFGAAAQNDFRLHRLQRIDDRIVDIVYGPEALDAALEVGMEVR